MSPLRLKRRLKTALRALLMDTPLLPGPPARVASFREPNTPKRSEAPCPAASILNCAECPVCGCALRTIVNEFNKLILLDWLPGDAAERYDHALCHDCGIVYASRRPTGPRYRWLFEHFELAVGRTAKDDVGNLLASAFELSAEQEKELRRRAARGARRLRLGPSPSQPQGLSTDAAR